MDIVIPWKYEETPELKFALRSLKNIEHDRVFLITDRVPKWLTGVETLFYQDTPGYKQKSIYDKIYFACQNPSISSSFIKWHDDHYLMKPVLAFLNYYEKTLGWWSRRAGVNESYRRIIKNTIEKLGTSDALYYDIHTPIVINKYKFIDQHFEWDREYLVKSLYGNYVNENPVEMKDNKGIINGQLFLSSSKVLSMEMKRHLSLRFPEKSRFEI